MVTILKLYIRQAGGFFNYKGKLYRTPVKLNINDSEIDQIKIYLRNKSILNYEFISDENYRISNTASNNKIEKTNNRMKKFLNINNNLPNQNRSIIKSKVIENSTPPSNFQTNVSYHDTIENDKIDIDIDLNSDDILEQLLAKI